MPKKIYIFIALATLGISTNNVYATEVVLDVEFNPAAINNSNIIVTKCGDGATACAKGKTAGYKWPKLTDHWDFDTWVRVKTGNKIVKIKLFNLDVCFGEHCVYSFDAHLAGEVYGCRRP